jgi:hypothetical protein
MRLAIAACLLLGSCATHTLCCQLAGSPVKMCTHDPKAVCPIPGTEVSE